MISETEAKVKYVILENEKKQFICKCGSIMKVHYMGALTCTDKDCFLVFDWMKGWVNGLKGY